MKQIKIEGIATFGNGRFSFNSGLPSEEPLFNEARKMHGTLRVSTNGCADFEDNHRIYLPPLISAVAEGEGYRVKRTSRHYLIALKVPVVEKRADTEARLAEMMPRVMGEIVLDRQEIVS